MKWSDFLEGVVFTLMLVMGCAVLVGLVVASTMMIIHTTPWVSIPVVSLVVALVGGLIYAAVEDDKRRSGG